MESVYDLINKITTANDSDNSVANQITNLVSSTLQDQRQIG